MGRTCNQRKGNMVENIDIKKLKIRAEQREDFKKNKIFNFSFF